MTVLEELREGGGGKQGLTEAVLDRFAGCAEPRLRRVLRALIGHLHAFASEVQLSEAEWMCGIDFLTRVGRACEGARQEVILLSDVLGLSMLVDSIEHRGLDGATESTVLGPFFRESAPEMEHGASIVRSARGEPTRVRGRVLDREGRALTGARVEVWQADGGGHYDVQRRELVGAVHDMDLRAVFRTDDAGSFWFWTVKPVSYPVPTDGPVGELLRSVGLHPFRPAHIHVRVSHPDFRSLTTHVFVAGDPYLRSDAVFGVKAALIVPFERRVRDSREPEAQPPEFWDCSCEFRLARHA